MSDIAMDQASALVQHFAEAASYVLSQVAGTELQAQPVSLENATDAATVIRIGISGALEGLCEIAISAAMTSQFAALLTGEAPEAEVSNDAREAAAELIQQICGNAADRLRRAFGPLELKAEMVAERDAATGARQLLLINRENDCLEFELHIVRLEPAHESAAEAEAVSNAAPSVAPSATLNVASNAASQAAASPPPAQPASQSAAESAISAGNRNLDLLLDVELGASLRFGACQMLLKDIIELCSGSVVELDRRVQEPVDLLIDGRVIAQGEVVIVDGNYGLRIQQVASPGEKVACLPC
jgi:flagellar motor switch protein FliN/FliY